MKSNSYGEDVYKFYVFLWEGWSSLQGLSGFEHGNSLVDLLLSFFELQDLLLRFIPIPHRTVARADFLRPFRHLFHLFKQIVIPVHYLCFLCLTFLFRVSSGAIVHELVKRRSSLADRTPLKVKHVVDHNWNRAGLFLQQLSMLPAFLLSAYPERRLFDIQQSILAKRILKQQLRLPSQHFDDWWQSFHDVVIIVFPSAELKFQEELVEPKQDYCC